MTGFFGFLSVMLKGEKNVLKRTDLNFLIFHILVTFKVIRIYVACVLKLYFAKFFKNIVLITIYKNLIIAYLYCPV